MLKSEFINKIKNIKIDTYISKTYPNTEKEIVMYNGTDLEDRIVTNVLCLGNNNTILLTVLYTRKYKLKVFPDNDLNLRHKYEYLTDETFSCNIKEDLLEVIDDDTNEKLTKEQIETLIKNETEILNIKIKGIE